MTETELMYDLTAESDPAPGNGHVSDLAVRDEPLPGAVTDTALVLPPDLSYPEWEEAGRRLQRWEKSLQWWIGDWLVYGEDHFPDRYSQALEATEYAYRTLANCAYVARAIPGPSRRRELTFSHHSEVASLPAAERELVLDQAESEGWNRYQTRHAAKRAAAERTGTPMPEVIPCCKVCGQPCPECEFRAQQPAPRPPVGGGRGG